MLNEFAILVFIAVAGAALAWRLGVRNLWLSVPVGLMISSFLRILIFSTLNLIDQRWLAGFVFFGVMAVGLVYAAWKGGIGLVKNMALGAGFAILAVSSTRLLGFQGTPHGDSLWILAFVRLFDQAGDIQLLDGRTAIKRGFAYPLMLALGPDRQYLSGLTPFIYAALCCLVIWAVKELLGTEARRRVLWVAGVLFVLTFSTVMPLRAIFYINGHTLTAIGMLITAVVVAVAVRDGELTRQNLLLAGLGTFTASTSRIEGIIMCALIVLPLLSQRWLGRNDIRLLVSSGTVGLCIWLSTYHSYFINATDLPWFVFSAIVIAAGLLPSLRIFDWLRFRLVPVALISMVLVFVAAEVIFSDELAKGNRSLWINLINGSGRWGIFFVGLALAFALGRMRHLTPENKTLLQITAALVVGSLVTKMLDGGQFGNPTLGRVGWSDSLNRMWLQSFAIFLVSALVGLVQNPRLWGHPNLPTVREPAKATKGEES